MLLGILFTITCLVAFIYFIHNISQSIQINNILDTIFSDSRKRLKRLIDSKKEVPLSFPDTQNWHNYNVGHSGYIQNIAINNILDICERENTKIYITIPKGLFALSNAVFIKSEKKLKRETVNQVLSNISFSKGELVEDNYILAFKQITEIAVKAMSPGINDPGTAINAIDYLTELFALRMLKGDKIILTQNNKILLRLATVRFNELIYNVMASLRTYCKHDPIMAQKILWMLNYLKDQPVVEESYHASINEEIKTMVDETRKSLECERDVLATARILKI